MVIDLKRVFVNDNSSLPIDYTLDFGNVDYAGGYPLKKPVTVKGSVSNSASLVTLRVIISFDYDAPCDRCGVDTTEHCTVEAERLLAVSIEGEESDSIIPVPDMKLDMDEFVYTEVIINLPVKHLCREDCKGICLKCGKNLNEGSCGCSDREIDPRLSALKDLLDN